MFAYPVLTDYLRKLRGGSQPVLVRASDGELYVVKFANNLQGSNVLFNECAGNLLYRACGLPVPEWKVLKVDASFLDRNPACWIETEHGRRRPEEGFCYGTRYLGGRVLEVLPGSSMSRIENRACFWLAWMIDICAGHTDNRQALFVENSKGGLHAVFVDHGHLLGGPRGEQEPNDLASRYLDLRIYEHVSLRSLQLIKRFVTTIDFEGLWLQVQDLPMEWRTDSACQRLSMCIERLSNDELLGNIVNKMARCHSQAHGRDFVHGQHLQKAPVGAVLCFGV
jgi:hypothetical protein